jgi:hypothetical protein
MVIKRFHFNGYERGFAMVVQRGEIGNAKVTSFRRPSIGYWWHRCMMFIWGGVTCDVIVAHGKAHVLHMGEAVMTVPMEIEKYSAARDGPRH